MMSEVTLDSVDICFQQWRSQRGSRTEPIPERLWTMALSLYPQYKSSHICRRLSLSGSQFKQRAKEATGSLSDNGFVLAAPDVDIPSPKLSPEVVLGIEGQRRTLTLKMNIDSLSQVLPNIDVLL